MLSSLERWGSHSKKSTWTQCCFGLFALLVDTLEFLFSFPICEYLIWLFIKLYYTLLPVFCLVFEIGSYSVVESRLKVYVCVLACAGLLVPVEARG